MNIFSDKRFLPQGQPHIVMLYPFWGKNPENPDDPSSGRFDAYAEVGKSIFSMTRLEDAVVAVLPSAWENICHDPGALALAESFISMARDAQTPVVVFFCSDSEDPLDLTGTLVLRTSIRASDRQSYEFAVPAWSEDFVERYAASQLILRPKADLPVVGFCGYAGQDASTWGFVRRKIEKGHLPRFRERPKGARLRSKAMRVLESSPLVETNFLVRDQFFGEIVHDEVNQSRHEYVENMFNSDYILCVRGGGNFSYRLYETLSCGRVPVFVNTDCCLPYEDLIDWKTLCVWVEEKDLGQVAVKVAEHYAGLSDQRFKERQKECRRVWEDYLSPTGFFAHLHRHFNGVG